MSTTPSTSSEQIIAQGHDSNPRNSSHNTDATASSTIDQGHGISSNVLNVATSIVLPSGFIVENYPNQREINLQNVGSEVSSSGQVEGNKHEVNMLTLSASTVHIAVNTESSKAKAAADSAVAAQPIFQRPLVTSPAIFALPVLGTKSVSSARVFTSVFEASKPPVEHNPLGAPNSALTKSELQAKRRVNRRKNRQTRKEVLARADADAAAAVQNRPRPSRFMSRGCYTAVSDHP